MDLGCGTGRLAVHAIPTLAGGHYVGIDIAQSMLDHARALIDTRHPSPPCRVTWQQQRDDTFQLPDASADMMCAFSVFTHMEHEDTFRYLVSARRVVRPGGRFLFSCLPMSLAAARDIFRESASRTLAERWATVRNVTTTPEMMETLATMAGWTVRGWYASRRELVSAGMPDAKLGRVVGLAASDLLEPDNPRAPANRRITITVLTREAEERLMGKGIPTVTSTELMEEKTENPDTGR